MNHKQLRPHNRYRMELFNKFHAKVPTLALQVVRKCRQRPSLFYVSFALAIAVWYALRSSLHSRSVTFFVLGDFGVDDEDPVFAENLEQAKQVSKTLHQVARRGDWPRAVFLTGDLAYPSGILEESDNRIDRVFDRIPIEFRKGTEFYATPGNHDCEGSLDAWVQVRNRITNWKSPRGESDVFGENVFDLPWGARLRLLTLETCTLVCTPSDPRLPLNHRCGDKMSKYGTKGTFVERKSRQLEWMQKVHAKQPNEWLIVMGHWPVYSFKGNGPTREMGSVLEWMRNLRVDAYMCGHDHALQHITSNNPADPVFLVSGAGGYPLHKDLKAESDGGFNKEGGAQLVHAQEQNGFMTMRVHKDYMTLAFINLNGTETYNVVLNRKY